MKYCQKCEKQFETEEYICSTCKETLIDIPNDEVNEYEKAEMISTMITMGIL